MKNKLMSIILAVVFVFQFTVPLSVGIAGVKSIKSVSENGREYKFRVYISYIDKNKVYFDFADEGYGCSYMIYMNTYGIISEQSDGYSMLTYSDKPAEGHDNIKLSKWKNGFYYKFKTDNSSYSNYFSDYDQYITMRVIGSKAVITGVYVNDIPIEVFINGMKNG